MRMHLSLRRVILAAAALACFSSAGFASSAEGYVPPSVYNDLNSLADQPATHTGVVFDRSMMQVAQSVLEQGGLDMGRAAAALSTISFDTYRYKESAFYTPEVMERILNAYRRAGWKHFVNGNQSTANSAQPASSILDVWLHFSGTDIDHVSVLIRGTHEMSLVQVAGDLRPLDLLHLSGHFGIPKFDPNAVMVPAPEGR
ncbi:MAG TPA: hypothetical protein VHU44_15925 [Acidobacteriaceae bacterium]|jgi:hypothetical protein|nr:hypothetical protein [Acidobacteriaceae bacterium]